MYIVKVIKNKYPKKNIKTSLIGISDKKMTLTDENLRIIGIKSIRATSL